jgi:hypothetical protein
MRKQDRITNQQQGGEQHPPEPNPDPTPRETERTRGSASEETRRPERPHGKLPLPD